MATIELRDLNPAEFNNNLIVYGRLGVGASSPSEKLHIAGAGTQRLLVEETGSTVKTKLLSSTTAGVLATETDHPLGFDTNDQRRMTLTSTSLGIGTTNPLRTLHVAAGSTPAIGISVLDSTISDEQNIGAIYFGGSEDSGSNWDHGAAIAAYAAEDWTVGSAVGTDLTFWTVSKTTSNAQERMRILDDGKVGIGTTSPDHFLEIDGGSSTDVLHLNSTAPILKVTATNNASGLRINAVGLTSGHLFRVQKDGTTKFEINSDDNVGIGTTLLQLTGSTLVVSPLSLFQMVRRRTEQFLNWFMQIMIPLM